MTKLGYALKKTDITDIVKIKEDLTAQPYSKHNDMEEFLLYGESADYIFVPKYYGINNFGDAVRYIGMDGAPSEMKFTKELRDYQYKIVDDALNKLRNDGGGILSLYCGGGKTVLAIYIACTLKLKTLIVVHKTFLIDQWRDRIQTFSDAKVGAIRSKHIDIEGKDIVIGMLQSISMIDYDTGIFKDFGFVIYDEVHRFASKCFSKALYKTTSKYTLGLSATPDRPDRMTQALEWYIGDIYTRIKRDKKFNNKVHAIVIKYNSTDKLYKEKKSWVKKMGAMSPSLSIMTTNICKIEKKNDLIIEALDVIRRIKGRKSMILSTRVEHMKELKRRFDKIIDDCVKAGTMDPGELVTSLYYSGMKKYEQTYAAENADVFFATFQMAEEGLDIDGLNIVILASPPHKTKVEQSVGRGLRAELAKCDISPLIVDFSDTLSLIGAMADARMTYYRRENYSIKTYYALNDKLVSGRMHIMNQHGMDKDEYNAYAKVNLTDEEREEMKVRPSFDDIFNEYY